MACSQEAQPRRLLLVEDNPGVAAAIMSAAYANCFEVEWKQDLESATSKALDPQLDLILLDRGLPDGDGVHFMKDLRGAGITTPIIVISARARIEDVLVGLDAGADDYLAKPFVSKELMSRCNAVLRRGKCLQDGPQQAGNLRFRPETQDVEINGRTLILARRHLKLLSALLLHKERPCPRNYLQSVCSNPGTVLAPNSLEAIVCGLRITLQEAGADVSIKTIRGIGYMLAAPKAQSESRRVTEGSELHNSGTRLQ